MLLSYLFIYFVVPKKDNIVVVVEIGKKIFFNYPPLFRNYLLLIFVLFKTNERTNDNNKNLYFFIPINYYSILCLKLERGEYFPFSLLLLLSFLFFFLLNLVNNFFWLLHVLKNYYLKHLFISFFFVGV